MSYLNATIADQLTLNLIKADVHPFIPLISGGFAYYYLHSAVKEVGMGVANSSWNVHSTVLGLLTGIILWNEHINTQQLFGIGFGIFGLYLMNEK